MTTPDKSLDELREAVFRAFERCLLDGEDEDVCAPAVEALIARARQEGAEEERRRWWPCAHCGFPERLGISHFRGDEPQSMYDAAIQQTKYPVFMHPYVPVEADHDGR